MLMPRRGDCFAHKSNPGRCPGLSACCPVGASLLSNKIHFVKSRKRKPSPDNNVPANNVPANNVPANNVPANNVPANNVPAKNVPAKNVRTHRVETR